MAVKLNQIFTGNVNHLSSDGYGVIDLPTGKSILVQNTIPGEEVVVLTKNKTKNGVKAEVIENKKPSPHRVLPLCPYFGLCGGCRWQHIVYEQQLVFKKELIEKTFSKQKISLPEIKIIPCPQPYFYRNRMDFMFGQNGELGLKEANRWWSVIDLSECFLMSEETNEILSRLRVWTKMTGLPFWDNKKQTGFFRALIIREGKNTGERLIMLVTNKTGEEKIKKTIFSLSETVGDLATSIIWGTSERITDLSLADETFVIKGQPYLEEIINGLRYRIAPCSFFQTNSIMAAELQKTVMEFVAPEKTEKIMDLYCGAGFFSLALAKAGAEVIGIEADTKAIDAAKINANLNNLSVNFIAAKIEDYFKDHDSTNWTKIILDPPRAGLHPRVIETLIKNKPQKIIYVSCSYQHLVKELPIFLKDYEIKQATALDLFPQTPHVELILKLVKKQD